MATLVDEKLAMLMGRGFAAPREILRPHIEACITALMAVIGPVALLRQQSDVRLDQVVAQPDNPLLWWIKNSVDVKGISHEPTGTLDVRRYGTARVVVHKTDFFRQEYFILTPKQRSPFCWHEQMDERIIPLSGTGARIHRGQLCRGTDYPGVFPELDDSPIGKTPLDLPSQTPYYIVAGSVPFVAMVSSTIYPQGPDTRYAEGVSLDDWFANGKESFGF